MTPRRVPPLPAVALGTGVAVAVVVAAPLTVVLGANRLVALVVMAVGAWLVVGRAGVVDLATGAAAGAGAYLGGVAAGVTGLPVVAGLALGAVAGAVVTGASAGVAARVGRTAGALTSLALGTAVVALLRALAWGGGASGYHAVPLLTGSDRGDLAVALLLLVGALVLAVGVARSRLGARARLAAEAPVLAASLGRLPVADAATVGTLAGAVLGLGGALQAFLVGSVAPAGFGLTLSAALALAAVVGGAAPAGPVVGALLLWAPAVVWPLVPVVGDTPVLLSTGLAALVLLGLRRGRPLVHPRTPTGSALPVTAEPTAPSPLDRAGLTVRDVDLPGGRPDLRVEPGEVVALVGPNGSGKSTLLARIAGQLPDDGHVAVDGRRLGGGATVRARQGIARTWQRPPEVSTADALVTALSSDPDGDGAAAAAAWAVATLGAEVAATPAGAQLVRLVARRPLVALLDEPGAHVPVGAVARLVRGLAEGGAAVLVVEHRAELVATADRVVTMRSPEPGEEAP